MVTFFLCQMTCLHPSVVSPWGLLWQPGLLLCTVQKFKSHSERHSERGNITPYNNPLVSINRPKAKPQVGQLGQRTPYWRCSQIHRNRKCPAIGQKCLNSGYLNHFMLQGKAAVQAVKGDPRGETALGWRQAIWLRKKATTKVKSLFSCSMRDGN